MGSSFLILLLYFFSLFFSMEHFSCDLYGWKNVNIRDRTQTRHLSFPRFYSRRLILNRGSQGRLRNPVCHCERTPTSFLPEALFHALSTELAQNVGREEGKKRDKPTCNVRTHRAHVHSNMRTLSLVRMISLPPFLPLYLFAISNLYISIIGDIEKKKAAFHKNKFNAREKLLRFLNK